MRLAFLYTSLQLLRLFSTFRYVILDFSEHLSYPSQAEVLSGALGIIAPICWNAATVACPEKEDATLVCDSRAMGYRSSGLVEVASVGRLNAVRQGRPF